MFVGSLVVLPKTVCFICLCLVGFVGFGAVAFDTSCLLVLNLL